LEAATKDGENSGNVPDTAKLEEFLAKTPFNETVRRDILRIERAKIDYPHGLTSTEKKDRLSRISYKDFLLNIAKVEPGVIPFYQTRTNGEWGVGIDAEPALDCWALGLPGFQGFQLEPGGAPHMSYSAARYANGGSDRFHFPDGNTSILRLLVCALIPSALSGNSVEDIVTARVNYDLLDADNSPICIRLNGQPFAFATLPTQMFHPRWKSRMRPASGSFLCARARACWRAGI
jgi:spermidine dehydrogenase